MADTNETIADIIAEMREIRVREFQDYADRLEAALKCERGNFAALREALKAIGDLCDGLMPTWDGAVGRIKDMAEAALAAPPRNCDVGTAEEQDERFAEYCESEVCKRKRCKFSAKALCIERCALVWAQMPYATEGGAM